MSTATFMVVAIFIAMASMTVSAQMDMSPSSGPTAAPDCLTNLLNMSDCLSYVQEGGSAKPDKACCPELAGLVDSALQCLCYLLGGNMAEQYGIKIDMPKALKLPQLCAVETPPSLCSRNALYSFFLFCYNFFTKM